MRTTLDLPDPVFRDLKTKAAQEGVTLKKLLTRYVEKGLYPTREPQVPPVRSPLPVFFEPTGTPMSALTNARIEEIFLEEDAERCR